MSTSYAYMQDGKLVGPVSMRSRFNGVGAWHLLSEKERAEHGWYPCEVVGEGYNSETQTRSDYPELAFDYNRERVVATYSVTEKTLNQIKQEHKERVSQMRFFREISGKIYEGIFYDTDRTTQSMLGNAVSLVQFDPEIVEVDWKSSDGSWTKVSKTQLLEMGKIVGRHVQDCFSKECKLHKLIDACETKEEVLKVVWEE